MYDAKDTKVFSSSKLTPFGFYLRRVTDWKNGHISGDAWRTLGNWVTMEKNESPEPEMVLASRERVRFAGMGDEIRSPEFRG